MSTQTPALRITTISGESSKGRSFSGLVLAMATSSNLWVLGGAKSEALRPIMMVVAASEQEARPLFENLRAGSKATLSGGDIGRDMALPVEFMKSGDYDGWNTPQPLPSESAVVLHISLPSLFWFVPPVINETKVSFVVMPSAADLAEVASLQAADIEDALSHVRQLGYPARELAAIGMTPTFAALAAIWSSHLQRRTIWAIPQKLAFRVQLLLACLKQGITTMGDRSLLEGARPCRSERPWWNSGVVDFSSYVQPRADIHTGLATMANGEFLQEVFAREVAVFDSMRRGKSSVGRAA